MKRFGKGKKEELEQNELADRMNENDDIYEDEAEEQDIISIAKRYKTYLIAAAAVVIVAIGLFFYIRAERAADRIEAATALTRILPLYNNEDYQQALYGDSTARMRGENVIGLTQIADNFGSSEPGQIAALLAGNAFIALDKPNEARQYFKIAEVAASKTVSMGGMAGLGLCLENEGKFAEAARLYEDAANMSDQFAIKSRYLYFAAMNYEKTGEGKRAEQFYREIVNDTRYSDFTSRAKAGLVRLGTIID